MVSNPIVIDGDSSNATRDELYGKQGLYYINRVYGEALPKQLNLLTLIGAFAFVEQNKNWTRVDCMVRLLYYVGRWGKSRGRTGKSRTRVA